LKNKTDFLEINKNFFMTNQPISDFSIENSNSHSSSEEFQNSLLSRKTNQSQTGESLTGRSSQTNFQASKNGNHLASQKGGDQMFAKGGMTSKRKVFSVSQILARVHQKKQRKFDQKKRKKPLKPIIPPKSFLLLFQEKPEKYVYNRRIIDYKHCGLLQRYIGLGGKILPRRQTKLTAKQQRYVAKTIKSARIMGLLPFVTKEKGFFR
jgi:small subunit ribosomal protein S18